MVPYLLLRVGIGWVLALVLIHYFCTSIGTCRIPRSGIECVRRSGRKISFRARDHLGKLRRSIFRAADLADASRIERLLSRS